MVLGNLFNIAKNPILHYLSRFAKNLSPEHLKLSFVKGEGELTNLELNEEAIMQLLDLPTWLRLRSARCNRVCIRCQWTKLQKQPLCLTLDEVTVEIEALDSPRPPHSSDTASYKDKTSDGRYSFADKVIDGIDLCVNSVAIVFVAKAFRASIQLSRVHLYSVLPTWTKGDLKFTYLRSRARDQILLFKEVVWETTRFEAGNSEDWGGTLVRLITNTSRIRLTMKKNLADSRIVASRLELLLDDLLWVLTVSQLEATVMFVKSLQKSVEKSKQQSKQLAKKKLEQSLGPGPSVPSQHRLSHASALSPAQQLQQQRQSAASGASSESSSELAFRRFDILETSYHLHTGRVDLHFCEESSSDSKLSESSVVNGAIQLTLLNIGFHLYPMHPFTAGRSGRWLQHTEANEKADRWHYQRVEALGGGCQTDQLIESCVTVSLQDFCMGCVTSTDASKNNKAPFLASDKARLQLPRNTVTAFVDFTEFFYPATVDAAAPLPCLYAHLSPLHLRLDFDTLIWLNAFSLKLSKNLEQLQIQSSGSSEPLHVLAESIFPRLLIPAKAAPEQQPPQLHQVRPTVLEAQADSVTISNDPAGFADSLAAAISAADASTGDFPGDPDFDWLPFRVALAEAAASAGPAAPPSSVWHLRCPRLWCDFAAPGADARRTRRQPCLDAGRVDAFLAAGSSPDCFAVLLDLPSDPGRELRLALTHLQYLFLLRMGEDFADFADCLQRDRRGMRLPDRPPGPVAAVWLPIPRARLRLLLDPACPASASDSCCSSSASGDSSDADTDPGSEDAASFARQAVNNSCSAEGPPGAPAYAASAPVEFLVSGASSSPSTASASSPSASPIAVARQQQHHHQQQQQSNAPQQFVERLGRRLVASAKHRGSAASLDSGGSDVGDDWERVSVSSDDLSASEVQQRRLQLLEEAEAAAQAAAQAGACLAVPGLSAADNVDNDEDEDETTGGGGGGGSEVRLPSLTGGLLGSSVLVTVDHAGSLVRIASRRVGLAAADDANSRVALSAALTARQPRVDVLDDLGSGDGLQAEPARLRVRVYIDEARTLEDPGNSEVFVQAADLSLSAGLSVLAGLGDFFEDEKLLPALPMRLLVEAVKAELVSDQPCLNATCPGEHPSVQLEAPGCLSMLRGTDNVMRIVVPTDQPRPDSVCSSCLKQNKQQKQSQAADSDELAKRLARCQAELAAVRAERDDLLRRLGSSESSRL
ncbi:hypothetical protein BOX15_Mlig023696g1 [Macrostomum lignano]|uniref:Uncharacterized protein n=3 Tax=Macrostomum lignano TaxID=282301 RepID=A0A267G648_9PLAT|nr:hypothetical protein BOX15_Mlig023696g1 [Macrostomum lignano]